MKKNRFFLGCTTILLALLLWPVGAPAASAAEDAAQAAPYVEGEVLVELQRQAACRSWVQAQPAIHGDEVHEFPVLSLVQRRPVFLLRSAGQSTAELLRLLADHPDVAAVAPNYRRRLYSILPNDPAYAKLWGLPRIAAPQAWDTVRQVPEVVVGVIDSGIDYTHEDLRDNMWRNPGEVPGNGRDDDGNGFIDDVYGYDFGATENGGNDSDPMDNNLHGSHVAGIVAAAGNNGVGVTGVCWSARLMALKVARPNGFLYDSDSLEAIQYAIVMKQRGVNIRVLNASYGGSGFSQPFQDAISAAGQAGMVFVAASGNGGDDGKGLDLDKTPAYPAAYNCANIIAVAAVGQDDKLADFSNFGAQAVDIAAPGVGIYSTVPFGRGQESWLSVAGLGVEARHMTYSGEDQPRQVQGRLYHCGAGLSAADFPAAVRGHIALVERGGNSFQDKIKAAQAAGATAMVVYNNAAGGFNGTIGDPGEWIPAVSISREDGLLLLACTGGPLALLEDMRPAAYDYANGTSMAAPYVSGAVALLAGLHPTETPLQCKNRVMGGAERNADLVGKVLCAGRLNILQALAYELDITLEGRRGRVSSWLASRDCVSLTIRLNRLSASSGAQSLNIVRREGTSVTRLQRLSVSSLSNGRADYVDRHLPLDKTYGYHIEVLDASGRVIGVSNEIQL